MRQHNRYGRLKERRFMFTRREVEVILRDYAKEKAQKITLLPTERVETFVEMDTDGIDLEGPLFTVVETFTDLHDEPSAEPTR